MRSLLFLSALMILALAVDASEFGGRYRKALLVEANFYTQQFANKVNSYFAPRIN